MIHAFRLELLLAGKVFLVNGSVTSRVCASHHMAKARNGKEKSRNCGRRSGSSTKKLGQAATLAGGLWAAWIKHLLATGPTWVYIHAIMCHMFCLRATEGLGLRGCDFDWRARSVRIRALKRQPEAGPLRNHKAHHHNAAFLKT